MIEPIVNAVSLHQVFFIFASAFLSWSPCALNYFEVSNFISNISITCSLTLTALVEVSFSHFVGRFQEKIVAGYHAYVVRSR